MDALSVVLLVLLVASVALHVIAPKTKTPYDDAAAEVVDKVRDELAKRPAKK